MKELCTVIIPSFNSEKTIKAAVDSALAQTYENIEILICDGNSQDATEAIIKNLQQQDSRITYIKDGENLGVAYARNLCIAKSQGQYIAFLDSDDIWAPDKLEKQIHYMAANGCDICYTSYRFVNMAGCETKKPYLVPEKTDYIALLKEDVIGMSTAVVRSEIAKKHQMPQGLCEDYCYWLKLLKDGAIARGLREVLCDYRLMDGSRSHNKRKGAAARWRVLRKVEGIPLLRAAYYFSNYAIRAVKKYYA